MVARSLNSDGCEFGRMVKKDLNFLVKKIESGFGDISSRLDKTDNKQIELFNHQSSRLPTWATVTIAVMTAIIGGLIGVAFN